MRLFHLLLLFTAIDMNSCRGASNTALREEPTMEEKTVQSSFKANKTGRRTVHVLVALCDNKYQGIVPVGRSIGNGQDPASNLYWGCDYGVKTYLKRKNSDWTLLDSWKNVSDTILERILFKHKTEEVYLLADAYNGQYIRQTTTDFLDILSGERPEEVIHREDTLYFGGKTNLVSYIGHNGLMDFELTYPGRKKDTSKKEAIILACASKAFFASYLQQLKATPLLWTTNLMAPEAYTLHDALAEWIRHQSAEDVRTAAAKAYAKYQKCGISAARKLLVTGY